MNIPNTFNNAIADTFYDKTFTVWTSHEVTDSEGWAKVGATESETTFSGNINFSKLDEVKQEYGITTDILATVTTAEEIALGTIVEYEDSKYRVMKSVKFDSHYLLILEEWSSKSSTLTSA